jgi:hypothetical protein
MIQNIEAQTSRRALLRSALVGAGTLVLTGCGARSGFIAQMPAAPMAPPLAQPVAAEVEMVPAATPQVARAARLPVPQGVRPELYDRALAALDKHASLIDNHDRIAIADFTMESAKPRFHFINLGTGQVETLLVAHGMGSDPEHTGLLHRFSNDPGSNATCEGAFLATDYYVGKHGQSQRLIGLDRTNNNALDRAIVVHAAWYSNPEMIAQHGKLGRSQGCFAVGERDLSRVFAQLGQGRMIYAAKA